MDIDELSRSLQPSPTMKMSITTMDIDELSRTLPPRATMGDVLSRTLTPRAAVSPAKLNMNRMVLSGREATPIKLRAGALSPVTPIRLGAVRAVSPYGGSSPNSFREGLSPRKSFYGCSRPSSSREGSSPLKSCNGGSRPDSFREGSSPLKSFNGVSKPNSFRSGSSPLKSFVYAPPTRTSCAPSPTMTLPTSRRTLPSPARTSTLVPFSQRKSPLFEYRIGDTISMASTASTQSGPPTVSPVMTPPVPVRPDQEKDLCVEENVMTSEPVMTSPLSVRPDEEKDFDVGENGMTSEPRRTSRRSKEQSGEAPSFKGFVANFDHTKFKEKDIEERDEHIIFNWLAWAPEPSSICYQVLHKEFPGALPGEAVNNRIRSLLQTEEYGFNKANTLVGHSLCPDEINHEPGCLVDLVKQEWGHLFPLGGISGAPFVGVTGFAAFSHHVPDDGNIIIIFGPHVGLSYEGLIGKVRREGQNHLSTACGAVIGAYNACSAARDSNNDEEVDFNPTDMQMGWIKSQLQEHIGLIQAQPNPIAALAYQAYEMVKAKLETIVNLDFGSGKLVLIGGIQINMPHQFQEHFLPLSFDIRQKGKPSQNLLPEFGCKFNEEKINFAKHWGPLNEGTQRSTSKQSPVLPGEDIATSVFKQFSKVKAANFDFSAELALDEKNGKQHAVFAWMTWSPEPGTSCFQTLRREFPGALPGPGVHGRLRRVLTEEYGFTQANTLFGTSTCPDEINNSAGGLSALMSRFWGSCFPLGGLAGVPFSGKTGFKAFSHHVPVNGDIIVLYGPHVGISASGEVGKHLRKGQDNLSTACGACIGAYNACCAEGGGDFEFDEVDIQMGFIKSQIAPHAKRIQRQRCPMAALAYQAFEAVEAKVNQVVNTEFGSGRLVLIGGIQINLPEPCSDHFLPLSCKVQQAGKPALHLGDLFNIPSSEVAELRGYFLAGDFAGDFAGA